jgi:hypothetical protein
MSSIRDAYKPAGWLASHQRTLVSRLMSGAFLGEGDRLSHRRTVGSGHPGDLAVYRCLRYLLRGKTLGYRATVSLDYLRSCSIEICGTV